MVSPLLDSSEASNLLDAAGVGLAEVLPNGQFVRANARLCEMLGCSREVLLNLTLHSILPRNLSLAGAGISWLERHPSSVCQRLKRSDGGEIWVELVVSEVTPSGSANHYLVTFIDITRFKSPESNFAEGTLRTTELQLSREGNPLAWELNHRLRNVFPIILLIVKMTAERHPTAAEYSQALERRLRALASAEDLMRQTEASSVTLEALLRTELLPFQDNARITIDGPAVALQGAVAQCVAILLHELTTNAAKYGSLGATNGKLVVGWQLTSRDDGERVVALEWCERGGPTVLRSDHSGFGTYIINKSGELLGGTAEADYAPEGLRYRLDFPLHRARDARDPLKDL